VAAKKPEPALRTRALRCLARREYSRAELHARLLPHVQEGDDLDAELDALAARGWLSDARAADQLLSQRRGRFGARRITHELKQKGIGGNLIAAALPRLKETELEAARAVWQKKFSSPPKSAQEKARQIRFLQSRGFDLETISKVVGMASGGGAESD
jgi:regulatory protein